MRALVIALAMVATVGVAHADISKPKCKDPAHFIYTQTNGCIKRPQARQKTPAESYVNGLDAVGTDPKRAFTLFESACTARYAPACLQLGVMYQSGRGRAVAKDRDKANALFEKGCELGDGAGCQKRGSVALDADEAKEARGWFDKGCTKDDGVACGYLALMIDHGYGGAKDAADAKAKYEKAHKLLACPGSGMACYMRAYFLEAGLGVKADPAAALASYRQSCAESFGDGCHRVGKILDRDKGDTKDAVDSYVKACELENAESCGIAARRLSDADPKATYPLELAERACELNTRECGTLAQMYRLGRGMGKPDQVRATEIMKSACDAGDHYVCVTYAERIKDGVGVAGGKSNLAAAIKILEGACTASEATACTQLGQWTMDGKTDDAAAFRYADRGCTLKSARGCFLAGWMTRHARRGAGGLGGDPKKAALALDETGCELGSGNACDEAGELYDEANDPQKALARWKTGCAATIDQGGAPCVSLVRALALGKSAPKDLKGALAAAVRLCTLDDTRCPWIGGLTNDAADIELVKSELGPACAKGDHQICYAVGLALAKGTGDDKKRAREMFASACRAKHMTSCVAEADAVRNGIGGDPEPAKATAMFRKYCDDQRDAESCYQAAFDTRDTDGKATLDYADKGCTLGHAEACNIAGFTNYTARKPIAWDITAAVRYYTKACDLGSSSACGNLGEVYRFGLGASPDAKKSRELYQKSCEAGSAYGCAGYGHYVATGEGGAKQDLKEAERMWRESCEAEYIEACSELALLLQRQHGAASEVSRFQLRAFSLAEKQAPTNPEYMYWLGTFYRDGVATMKDQAKAASLFGKACDSFDPFGCIAAGKLLLAKHTVSDREQAHVYFQRACAAGVEDGCAGLKAAEAPVDGAVGPAPQQVHAKSGCACHGEVAPGGQVGMAFLVGVVAFGLRRRRR